MEKIFLSKKKIEHRLIDMDLNWAALAELMNCSENANYKRHTNGWPVKTAGAKLIEVLDCTFEDLGGLDG